MTVESKELIPFGTTLSRLIIVLVLMGLAFAMVTGVWNVWLYSLVKPLPGSVMEGVDVKGREVIIQLIIASHMGGLASIIFCLKSLSEPAVGRNNGTDWAYLFRPVYGAVMALVFFMLIRGGTIVFAGGGADIGSLSGISTEQGDNQALTQLDLMRAYAGGIGGLIGMFSREGMDKLQEVSETLFGRGEKGKY